MVKLAGVFWWCVLMSIMSFNFLQVADLFKNLKIDLLAFEYRSFFIHGHLNAWYTLHSNMCLSFSSFLFPYK